MEPYAGPILFFDGVCNLCNGAVQFVIKHDRTGKIRFASLQSAAGAEAQAVVKQIKGYVPDSLILYRYGRYFTESDAALEVARMLDGGWKSIALLRHFPKKLRDFVYRGVAKRRFKWFGKRDACMIPTAALKSRFIA